jgi:hypothetical protein
MTNPYLVQADKETANIPHSRYITGDTDAMWEKSALFM